VYWYSCSFYLYSSNISHYLHFPNSKFWWYQWHFHFYHVLALNDRLVKRWLVKCLFYRNEAWFDMWWLIYVYNYPFAKPFLFIFRLNRRKGQLYLKPLIQYSQTQRNKLRLRASRGRTWLFLGCSRISNAWIDTQHYSTWNWSLRVGIKFK
jgi:hypothetical protein